MFEVFNKFTSSLSLAGRTSKGFILTNDIEGLPIISGLELKKSLVSAGSLQSLVTACFGT